MQSLVKWDTLIHNVVNQMIEINIIEDLHRYLVAHIQKMYLMDVNKATGVPSHFFYSYFSITEPGGRIKVQIYSHLCPVCPRLLVKIQFINHVI